MKYIFFKAIFVCMAFSMNAQTSEELLKEMFAKGYEIDRLSLDMEMKERINDGYNIKKGYFKINYTPFQIYLKQKQPQQGMEILFKQGHNDNKAYINPNGFPWMTLTLDPFGETMRKNHHHPLTNSGYKHFIEVTENLVSKFDGRLDEIAKYHGKVSLDGLTVHKIIFTNPDFKYITYRTIAHDDIRSIARKFHISEYSVIENNMDKVSYSTIKPGTELTLPNYYGETIILYLYTETYLPYLIEVYDDKGLFEAYTFKNVKINPNFDKDTFNINNSNYNF